VFAVLYLLNYSANTVDLFAIVLAITLVVDDAIVVVENVTRNLEEHPDWSQAQATEQAMREIAGPVIATPWCWSRCSPRWGSSRGSRARSTGSSR
jgi:multidrug efflux pump